MAHVASYTSDHALPPIYSMLLLAIIASFNDPMVKCDSGNIDSSLGVDSSTCIWGTSLVCLCELCISDNIIAGNITLFNYQLALLLGDWSTTPIPPPPTHIALSVPQALPINKKRECLGTRLPPTHSILQ